MHNEIYYVLILLVGAANLCVLVLRKSHLRHPTEEYIRTDAKNKAVEFAPNSIITTDIMGVIIQWNKGAERKLGWRESEVIGKNIVDIIVPDRFKDAHNRGMQKFRDTGESSIVGKSTELYARHRLGSEIAVELRVAKYTSGPNTFLIAVLININDKMLLSSTIKDYEYTEEVMRMGHFKWDVLSDVVHGSQGFKDLYGIDSDGHNAEYFMKRIHAEDIDRVRSFLGKALEKKEQYTFVHRIVTGNMEVRNVQVIGNFQLTSTGDIKNVFGVIQML